MDKKLLQCKGLSLTIKKNGKVDCIQIDDTDVTSAFNQSGFYLMEARTQKWGNCAEQKGDDFVFEWDASEKDRCITFNAKIENISDSDKFYSLEYRIPVHLESARWAKSINRSDMIQEGCTYSNKSNFNHKFSNNLFPFGCIYNDRTGLSIAVPMDKMRFYKFIYTAKEGGYLSIIYDFALSGINDYGAKSCDFSFILYKSDCHGFRNCAQKYYELFPEYFSRKVNKSGNWIFTQNYEHVDNLSDFHIAFNETPNIKLDHKNGISSFKYIAPSEKWIAFEERQKDPEPTYEEYIARLEENC
ncbi:MAG: hypothetical protein ACYC5K_11905, partial [Saccharofermentanales bacterium]